MAVAFHFGSLRRCFMDKTLDVDCAFNACETQFSANLDAERTLSMKLDTEVKYSGMWI